VPICNRIDNPAFKDRFPLTYLSRYESFCRRNRVLQRLDFVPDWFCHTYEKIYSCKNFSEHPEYFMLNADGKRDRRQFGGLGPPFLPSHLMVWDYMVDFNDYFLPYPTFAKIAANLRTYRQYRVGLVLFQGKREDHGGDRVEKRAWVMAKLLWNPHRDYRALMRGSSTIQLRATRWRHRIITRNGRCNGRYRGNFSTRK